MSCFRHPTDSFNLVVFGELGQIAIETSETTLHYKLIFETYYVFTESYYIGFQEYRAC